VADAFFRAIITSPAPTVDKPTISSNLRLPGQYADDETGMHYNFRRYYDPDTGRGYNASGALCDEMAMWLKPYETWYEGLMPSLRADLIKRFATYASRERSWPAKRNPVTPV